MSDLSIVLVPHNVEPLRLEYIGECGSRHPVAIELSRGTWVASGTLGDPAVHGLDGKPVGLWEIQHGRRGLVLAWMGVATVPGLTAAEVALDALDDDEVPGWRFLLNRVNRILRGEVSPPFNVKLLARLFKDLGTILILDEKGKEGKS